MKFTIITVCYNAEKDIAETIKSVLEQSYEDFQYIIKDGGSTDSTSDIVKEVIADDVRVEFESSEDNGIYDAMNYAIMNARGEYVFFLNAGDVFHDSNVLIKVFDFLSKCNADVAYGDIVLKKNDASWVRKYRNKYKYKHPYIFGGCICHQAMFAKRELFKEKLFNKKYKVCADRDWQLYFLNNERVFLPMEFVIADVLTDGFSLQHVDIFEEEVESCLREYYPNSIWIYNGIRKIRKYLFVR